MNEANNVGNVVREILNACTIAANIIGDVQLILVNDGSTDDTGNIIERIAEKQPNTLCIHHQRNQGFGAAYKSGVRRASNEFVFMVPGENSVPFRAIVAILFELGKADMIISYPLNPAVRKKGRQLLSSWFQRLTKNVSPHEIRYYNGPSIFRRKDVLWALPRTNGHAYQFEIIVRLLNASLSFIEVGIDVRNRPVGRSKALRPMNVLRVLWTLVRCKLGSLK